MSHFLKKNAKLIFISFLVFCFLFVVLSCVYITPYSGIALKFNQKFLDGTIEGVFTGNDYLSNFCKGTLEAFNKNNGVVHTRDTYFYYMYNIMYDFDQQLQTVNSLMLTFGVVSCALTAVMLVCSNHSRRKYYISNLISGVVCPALSGIFAIVVLVLNIGCIGSLNKNLETLNWGNLANNILTYKDAQTWYNNGDVSHFQVNATPLIVYSVILVLFVIASGLLVAYNVYRYKDTQRQLKLEEAGE